MKPIYLRLSNELEGHMKQVLVTGASGYIAKHIVLQLIQAGYKVRGSLRSMQRGDEVRAAVQPHLDKTIDLDEMLNFVELDLMHDDGWNEALKDIDVLMHTASPFPLASPKNEDELIRPAVDGTLRALKAAHDNGVNRVVMTSSTASVLYRDLPEGGSPFDESHWTDVNHPACSAYSKSKTLAEKAAWEFVDTEGQVIDLTCINPGFVLGAPLDTTYGTSLQVMARMISGKDPALPQLGFASVDVRDVAAMHVGAIANKKTVGKRILSVSQFLWFVDLAKAVKAEFPDRKIPTRLAPNWLIRVLSLFDGQARTIVPLLGKSFDVSNHQAKSLLGMEFRDPRDSATESIRYLIDNKLA